MTFLNMALFEPELILLKLYAQFVLFMCYILYTNKKVQLAQICAIYALDLLKKVPLFLANGSRRISRNEMMTFE